MAVLSLLDQIALDLEQDENSKRIKKLIYFLSTNNWENNLEIVEKYRLQDLIENILQTYPTSDDLSSAIYAIVQNLNRQGVYSLVGKKIISKLSHLYNEETQTKQIVATFPKKENELARKKIADNLEKNKNSARIKKLIFALCKNYWENELKVIERFNFPNLIAELKQFYPTLNKLSDALNEIVQSLNRKEVYAEVAQTIITQIKPLYNQNEATTAVKITTEITPIETSDESTGIVAGVESTGIISRKESTGIVGDENLLEIEEKSVTVEEDFVIDTTQSPVKNSSTQPETSTQPASEINYDLFELRREIMNYTNPLRVKILAFSILHREFDYSEHDWTLLKGHELDELLYDLFSSCSTLAELEAKLANITENLPEADENSQTAGAIIQLITPFYAH